MNKLHSITTFLSSIVELYNSTWATGIPNPVFPNSKIYENDKDNHFDRNNEQQTCSNKWLLSAINFTFLK